MSMHVHIILLTEAYIQSNVKSREKNESKRSEREVFVTNVCDNSNRWFHVFNQFQWKSPKIDSIRIKQHSLE